MQLLLTSKFSDVGDTVEYAQEHVKNTQTVLLNVLVLVHNHDLIEEAIDGSTQGSQSRESGIVIRGSQSAIELLEGCVYSRK